MPMLPLEQRLASRYPRWFDDGRGRWSRPLLKRLARWSKLERIEAFLERSGHLRGFAFLDAVTEHLQLRYEVDARQLASLPAVGRLLIVANHPSGALDALALLQAVGKVRQDVKIVANDMLALVTPLEGLLLPVRIIGGRPGADSMRAIEQALEAEQCVIVFPAGEVSRWGLGGVRDSKWRQGFLRFACATGAPVVPVRIDARNSLLFYGTSTLFKPAATALLPREMYASRARPLSLHIGQSMRIDPRGERERTLRHIRRELYALGRKPGAAGPQLPQPLAAPIATADLVDAIARTELLGRTSDGKQIRLARLEADSALLGEIGRLRELTFRRVGEGTGLARDVDRFDAHYQHLLVWDAANARIAGAYRVARGAQMLARHGLDGLYTASLFRYADEAVPRLAEGMELGRSFVAPEYWGGRSLDYLWQGIGAYLRRYPNVRYLFGAVSISAALPRPAREQLVAYYHRYFGGERPLAAPLRPFRYFAAPPSFGDLDRDTAYGVLKDNLDALGASVPMLYKQYTDLCEPGGARFLAFGVDPEFSDCIDGLIEIDLHCVRPKKRQRYLQEKEAA